MMSHQNKQTKLEKVVRDCIKKAEVRSLVVTVSGGADSVALLASLSNLLPKQTRPLPQRDHLSPPSRIEASMFSIYALHCNFHLRGEESDRDQEAVESLCRQLNVPLIVKDFDVAAYREANKGTSVEMACRELRYAWFREMKESLGADRIATGHNADDNIETLFLNLLRGSGTTGLKGMVADSGEIIRPLLTIHRSEILDYLETRGLSYVTDSSNLSSDYRRNFLRNEVLPLIRTRWEGADKALDRTIALLQAENQVVEAGVSALLPPSSEALNHSAPASESLNTQDSTSEALTRDTILSFPAPELLIRRFIAPLSPFTTTPAEVLAALRANKPDIKRWHLPGGILLLRASRLTLQPD